MDFGLTPEQQEWQTAAIEFARTSLNDDMIARDHKGEFNRDFWVKCAEFGVQGLPVPEKYGGIGGNVTTAIAVMEGLGYGTKDAGLLFSINAHLWTNSVPILLYGTEEQKEKYLPGLCNGTLVGANGASEPESGSDVFAMKTRVVKKGDKYILNGTKMFVTNAQVSDLIVSYATLDEKMGVLGICGFIVEKDFPGVSISKKIDKMGLRTSPMAEIVFDNCEVPAKNLLGREGRGAEVFNCSMEWERSCILASCLGTMRRQIEKCTEYARMRKQFGKPIGKFQSVANKLVDMKLRLETARPLVYKIGWLKDQGKSAVMEAAMAKLYLSECFVKSSLDAIQVFGGYGYMTECELERDLRDAVGSQLYSGTSEIQRNIIASMMGL
ncbi:MAG: acyl-CoA dehydrogenase [Planctomycetota bacterium]|nr:MAG: acyl-CoA dehydrogenase [Planctomycetota bacterium]